MLTSFDELTCHQTAFSFDHPETSAPPSTMLRVVPFHKSRIVILILRPLRLKLVSLSGRIFIKSTSI